MDETLFHMRAEDTLQHCYERLEPAFDAGQIEDLDLHDGILTIVTQTGKTFIANKHTASRQIWLASPSGGLHFSYDPASHGWKLANGTLFTDQLARELAGHSIEVSL